MFSVSDLGRRWFDLARPTDRGRVRRGRLRLSPPTSVGDGPGVLAMNSSARCLGLCLLFACRAPSSDAERSERPLRTPPPAQIAGRDLGAKAQLQMIDAPYSETLRALKPTPERLAKLLHTRRNFAGHTS